MMMTAEEIRKRILDVVLENGGHLASSLGAVEIAMALKKVFDPEKDRILWDVGHQAYAWKIMTGRNERFETLRRMDGVSPFPNPAESPADAAVAGHAGSALSVALGMAAARDRKGTDEQIVAVIGDGSIVNGHSFEAINNAAAATEKVIVVLNDNDMAISKPAGSFARALGRLLTGVRYNRVKNAVETVGHKLRLTFLRDLYHRIESRVKGLFLENRLFENYGLRYIGPIDGHDLTALENAFTVAKEDKRSVIVHVVTQKGRGYGPAEENPTKYHGVGPRKRSVECGEGERPKSWSQVFGEAMIELARDDSRIVALTAGMTDGTGLAGFAEVFKDRLFDVGIAEGHMVGFAAGLAAGGLKPVVAVYSTFLQRAVDQVIHDVAIAKLPVVFCVDRAGVVGADGVTHQGLYDIALLRTVPNLTICQPKDAEDLKALLREALVRQGPTVIRYPRGTVPRSSLIPPPSSLLPHPSSLLPPRFAIWATGDWYAKACAVAERVGGVAVHARYLKPFDSKLLADQRAAGMKIVSLENGAVAGGFGEAIGAELKFGWPDAFVPHGSPAELERRFGLSEDDIVRTIQTEIT